MKVVCSMIVTPNGYIADLNGKSVSSKYNWDDFFASAQKYNNFVIGRKTMEVVGKGFDQVVCDYKIVVSSQKNIHVDSSFMLARSPQDALDKLKDKVDTLFLVGGGEINSAFAKQGLIDEVVLTIEPHILGKGINLFAHENFMLNLKLEQSETLEGNRLRIRYKVIK